MMRVKRIKDYVVDGRLLRVVKRGKLGYVKYDDKVIFNNLKSDQSFKCFWKDFKKRNAHLVWEPFKRKRLLEKQSMYIKFKETHKNRINKHDKEKLIAKRKLNT